MTDTAELERLVLQTAVDEDILARTKIEAAKVEAHDIMSQARREQIERDVRKALAIRALARAEHTPQLEAAVALKQFSRELMDFDKPFPPPAETSNGGFFIGQRVRSKVSGNCATVTRIAQDGNATTFFDNASGPVIIGDENLQPEEIRSKF